jgi:hypothetical protein
LELNWSVVGWLAGWLLMFDGGRLKAIPNFSNLKAAMRANLGLLAQMAERATGSIPVQSVSFCDFSG